MQYVYVNSIEIILRQSVFCPLSPTAGVRLSHCYGIIQYGPTITRICAVFNLPIRNVLYILDRRQRINLIHNIEYTDIHPQLRIMNMNLYAFAIAESAL